MKLSKECGHICHTLKVSANWRLYCIQIFSNYKNIKIVIQRSLLRDAFSIIKNLDFLLTKKVSLHSSPSICLMVDPLNSEQQCFFHRMSESSNIYCR